MQMLRRLAVLIGIVSFAACGGGGLPSPPGTDSGSGGGSSSVDSGGSDTASSGGTTPERSINGSAVDGNGIRFLSHYAYETTPGNHVIVADMVNDSGQRIDYVSVWAKIYDDAVTARNGEAMVEIPLRLVTQSGATLTQGPYDAGEKFTLFGSLSFDTNSASAETVHYALELGDVKANVMTTPEATMTVSDVTVKWDVTGKLYLSGTATCDDQTRTFYHSGICGVLYDESGSIIDARCGDGYNRCAFDFSLGFFSGFSYARYELRPYGLYTN